MTCLATSYLVDYGTGRDVARAQYEAHLHDAVTASTIPAVERAFGIGQDPDGSVVEVRDSLRWVDFLAFSLADAIEGARIDGELQAAGGRIPVGETMIAGVARTRGATLVTGDEHFDRIDGLAVERHRS